MFFKKIGPTKKIWYYEVIPPSGKKYSKARSIRDEDLIDCLVKWKNNTISNNSWIVDINEIISANYDLTAKNPTRMQKNVLLDPIKLLRDMSKIENEIHNDLKQLDKMIKEV